MLFNAYSDSSKGMLGVSVRSAGHIFAKAGRRISRPNGREDWLLFYVAAGSEHFLSPHPQQLQEGGFILFRPGEAQEHVHDTEQTGEFLYIHFDAPAELDLLSLKSATCYQAPPSAEVRDLFTRVITELQERSPAFEAICAVTLLEILARLSREIAHAHIQRERHKDKIATVIQLFGREYSGQRPLSEYAALCHMSKFHFLRVFKETTGLSPIAYKNKIRLEHARHLLEDQSLPVQEIAAQLGYGSPAHFCEAFKRYFAISPSQYRKNVQSGTQNG